MTAVLSQADAPMAPPPPSPHVRLLGLTIDRLSLKLALGVALLVVLPVGAGLYAMLGHHHDRRIAARARAAMLENQILESALRFEMLGGEHEMLASILADISSQPEVRGVLVVNHDGEIRAASRPDQVGHVLGQDSAECRVCHARPPEERHLSVLLDAEDGGVLRTVRPIANDSQCHACHDPEQRLVGMLILDISLARLHVELARDAAWIAGAAALLALLLFIGVALLVRHLVLRRLARLGQTARSIAAGKLSDRAYTGGKDMIAALAADFNRMAGAVSGLIAEVRDQEAQLTSLMNSLDDGLVVLDRRSHVIACNESFCRRMGIPQESVRGARCRDAQGGRLPCCQSAEECPASRCLATGLVQRAVFHVQNGDGDVDRVEEVYASPVRGLDGRVVQVVELWRDITERTEEEGRLAEIERLVSLGTLASGFSHEVNTPLASMLTCAEAVVSRIDESEGTGMASTTLPAIREHAEIIRRQVMRCRAITKQFLRFSRGIPPTVEVLDLEQKVREVVVLTTPTAQEAGVTLEVESRGGLPAVRTNTEVVHHVMLNLLVNAIQSCGDEGGTIRVRFLLGTDVAIQISDTGCGIPQALQGQIFEPLHSRKPQGTGLGLFLARTFMRRFGGDVHLISSEVGVGSCFQVTFARVSVATS